MISHQTLHFDSSFKKCTNAKKKALSGKLFSKARISEKGGEVGIVILSCCQDFAYVQHMFYLITWCELL